MFENLKVILTTAPILAFPNYSIPFILQTDASKVAISGVLLQSSENLIRPIAFASRKLSKTECNYTVSEKELLAIVYSYEQFLSYVYGRKIKIFTDHEPLVTMSKLKKPGGRLGRLFFRLVGVEYEIHHISGIGKSLPDSLVSNAPISNVQVLANKTSVSYPEVLIPDKIRKKKRSLINSAQSFESIVSIDR